MRIVIVTLAAAALLGGAAQAKPAKTAPVSTPAPAAQPAATPATPASATASPTSAGKAAAKPRTAISIDCSKQADAKGLHGKDRKAFRRGCIKPAKS